MCARPEPRVSRPQPLLPYAAALPMRPGDSLPARRDARAALAATVPHPLHRPTLGLDRDGDGHQEPRPAQAVTRGRKSRPSPHVDMDMDMDGHAAPQPCRHCCTAAWHGTGPPMLRQPAWRRHGAGPKLAWRLRGSPNSGAPLAQGLHAWPRMCRVPEGRPLPRRKLLHGDHDGGGLTALAFAAEHVVSAGREGGCVLWRAGAHTRPHKSGPGPGPGSGTLHMWAVSHAPQRGTSGPLRTWRACAGGAPTA